MTDIELARKAYARTLTIQAAALACAQILERPASRKELISSSQALAVAQKMRREVHGA